MENTNKYPEQSQQSTSPQSGVSHPYQEYDGARDSHSHTSSRDSGQETIQYTNNVVFPTTQNKNQNTNTRDRSDTLSNTSFAGEQTKNQQEAHTKEQQTQGSNILPEQINTSSNNTNSSNTGQTFSEHPTEKDLEDSLYQKHIHQSSYAYLRWIYGSLIWVIVMILGYFFLHTMYPLEVQYRQDKTLNILVGSASARDNQLHIDEQEQLQGGPLMDALRDAVSLTHQHDIPVIYDPPSSHSSSSSQNIPTSFPDTQGQTIPQQLTSLYEQLLNYKENAQNEKQKKLIAHAIKQYNDISQTRDIATLTTGVQSLQELVDKIAPLF